MIQLNWENEQEAIALPEGLESYLQHLTQLIADTESLAEGELGLYFVDDEEIRSLNAEYRSIDRATDVLSFAMLEEHAEDQVIHYDSDSEPFPVLYGDIIISAERAAAQAEDLGHSLLREICFLYVHGFLHLLGYDHLNEADEQVMTDRQALILGKAGIGR